MLIFSHKTSLITLNKTKTFFHFSMISYSDFIEFHRLDGRKKINFSLCFIKLETLRISIQRKFDKNIVSYHGKMRNRFFLIL